MPRIVAVVQARMGSNRLPGKVLETVGDRPIVIRTLDAMADVPSIDEVILATSDDSSDDGLAETVAGLGWSVHRGSVRDVLARCWEAVAPSVPDFVVRETADNPFVDAEIVAAQIEHAVRDGCDYVGPAGWPLGIAAEVAAAAAMRAAYQESTDPAEREHVMPYLYRRPDRFRICAAPPPIPLPPWRFTVDTVEDLAFVRAVIQRLRPGGSVSIGDLAAVLADDPALLDINRAVRQKSWREVEA